MEPRFLTILTGRNLPTIWQSGGAEPSIINEKTVAAWLRREFCAAGSPAPQKHASRTSETRVKAGAIYEQETSQASHPARDDAKHRANR
jgi:hypothetical protein